MLALDKVAENILKWTYSEILQREIKLNGFGIRDIFVNIICVAIP
jgi:hypothetical protein